MIIVGLMGAQFSKPLVANKVTHLICYKCEGEKYDLAKRMKKIKLVNHIWLEDCLKTWKLLPEELYGKSTYELEMMEAEAKDSDEETGDIAENLTEGRNVDTIPDLQNEMVGAQHHSRTSSKLSSPSTQQGFPHTTNATNVMRSIKEEKKFDQKLMSGGSNQIEQQSPAHCREHQINSNTDIHCRDTGFLPNDKVGNDLQFISRGAKNLSNSKDDKFSGLVGSPKKTPTKKSSEACSKRVSGFDTGKCGSPSGIRKSPRSSLSLQTAEKLVNSGRVEKNLAEVTHDICTSNLESEKEKGASACVGVRSPKQSFDADSGKRGLSSSSKTPRRSSFSLQTVEKLHDTNRNVGEISAEISVDACTSNVEQSKGQDVSACIAASSLGNVNGEGSGGLLPQKRKVDGQSNVSPATPKSRKLASSASKRIDARDPKTPVSSPLGKSKSVSLNPSSYIEDNTANSPSGRKSSPNDSSVKSNAKSASASRNLASEMLKSRKSMNTAAATSTCTGGVVKSTALSVDKKEPEVPNQQQKASSSSCTKELEVAKSASPRSDDQMGNSVSKPSRKKTVAKKTLGSKAKLSKKATAAHKNSLMENPVQDETAIHSIGQEGHEKSPSSDKLVMAPTTMGAPVDVGSKPLSMSGSAIDAGLLDDETEAPAELDVQNENSVRVKLPHIAETRSRGGSGVLLGQRDEADVTTSTSDKKHMQGVTLAETVDSKKKLVTRKKGFSCKTHRNTVLSSKELPNSADDTACGVSGEKVAIEREQIECIAGDKSCGTLLRNKSKGPGQVAEETLGIVSNVQATRKGDKQTKKLAGKKRRGTLLLTKPDGPVQDGRENEPDPDGPKEKNNEENNTGKLATKSQLNKEPVEAEKQNGPVVSNDQGTSKRGKHAGKLAGKKRRGTLEFNKLEGSVDEGKENETAVNDAEGRSNSDKCREKLSGKSNKKVRKSDEMAVNAKLSDYQVDLSPMKHEPARFLLSGHRLQRKEFQQIIKRLNGKLCRDSHQWSYQATHLIIPEPLRRTEKFFAAAASGRWILKSDYLTESSQGGKFLPEEPYEWHKNGLSEDGAINLEAPRKWRLLRQKTGHGAFYGMRIVIYGECIAPPLDTLKRVVKAGDGTILATSPPYSRFIKSGVDFAIVSPGMPRADIWVQEFLRHEIPCVSADYLVEYVCKPGYSLDRHVQYNTHEWAAKSSSKLLSLSEEIIADAGTPDDQELTDDLACQICDSTDRDEVMLICGDESGSAGCGLGMHIDCLDPPLKCVPEEDWFCPRCTESINKPPQSTKKKLLSKSNR